LGGDTEGGRVEARARPLEAVPAGRVVRVLPDVAAVQKTFDYTVPASLDDRVRVGTQVRVVLHGRRLGGWVVEEDVAARPGVELRPIEAVRGWGPPPSVVSLAQWAAWWWAGPVTAFLKAASAQRSVASLPPAPVTRGARLDGRRVEPSEPAQRDRPPARTVPGWGPLLDEAVGEAFSGGITVVRMAPAADLYPLAVAASGALEGAAARAGVLVLVPERGRAGRLAARLSGARRPVALLPEDWSVARAGGCVVVGTRTAALAPLPLLAGALVLDAHDEAYHEQRAPTWCAWELVAERARRDGAPCALVSPCPTLELLAAGRLVRSSRRAEREGWPALEIVDRRGDDPRTGLFSQRVVSLVRWAGERSGRRVLCVLNRTGRARLLACGSCYELARCEHCGGALELMEESEEGGGGRQLRCRRCAAQRPVVCARCGAARMRTLRVGVSRAREELAALTGVAVAEVWGPVGRRATSEAESTGSRHVVSVPDPVNAHRNRDELDAAVIVGTEAVLHRAHRADAVAFLDFDAELLAPRMRAAEEALTLLARASRVVAGSAGRQGPSGRASGEVLVQTRMPGHEVLAAALSADPGRLSESERSVRQALRLPPFGALAVLSGAAADAYGDALREAAPRGVEVSGPVDGRWSVRAEQRSQLCALLAGVKRPAGRLRVEVDPVRA